ncbi:MAG: site-specific DNA-methyltransferase [Bacteroidales bacterium]|nr:site-specific DNA-methyltransferase [Bacteroidales bacterium]
MSYTANREKEFLKIIKGFKKDDIFSTDNSLVIKGDSLEVLKSIPDNSISLILTDPPYHSTKKDNITNDKAFKTDQEFIEWIANYTHEWKRILRQNGSLFLFCSSAMSAKLETLLSVNFNVLSHIVWTKPNDPGFDGWKGKMKKEALRQWYPHSERILFAEPAINSNLKRSCFGHFLKEKRILCGMSSNQVAEIIGAYGKVNHGGSVSNWEAGRNIPSKEQYSKICQAFINSGKIDNMPDYEDVIRKFEVSSEIEFTDVWNFNSVKPYKGKHPAEKPIDLLEHCISATTFERDIVLDCFAGSGSTAIASLKLGRHSISIELEDEWVEKIKTRILNMSQTPESHNYPSIQKNIMKIVQKSTLLYQKSLFD